MADTVRQKFTGQQRDQETGLDYFGARYYSSGTGRFTSADTLIGSIANPQTLNLYAYTLNNPLRYIDPTGHDPSPADDCDYYDDEEQVRSHKPEPHVYVFVLFSSGDQKTEVAANSQTGVNDRSRT